MIGTHMVVAEQVFRHDQADFANQAYFVIRHTS